MPQHVPSSGQNSSGVTWALAGEGTADPHPVLLESPWAGAAWYTSSASLLCNNLGAVAKSDTGKAGPPCLRGVAHEFPGSAHTVPDTISFTSHQCNPVSSQRRTKTCIILLLACVLFILPSRLVIIKYFSSAKLLPLCRRVTWFIEPHGQGHLPHH